MEWSAEIFDKLKAYDDILERFGSIERAMKAIPEENVLKFYYYESRDQYLVGQRHDSFYYGYITPFGDLTFYMSRYLPWGEHVVAPTTSWKEHTYPSEPVEIPFTEWLTGVMKQQGWKWNGTIV